MYAGVLSCLFAGYSINQIPITISCVHFLQTQYLVLLYLLDMRDYGVHAGGMMFNDSWIYLYSDGTVTGRWQRPTVPRDECVCFRPCTCHAV